MALDLRGLEEELKKLGVTVVSGQQDTVVAIKIRGLAGRALVRGLRLADQLLQEKVKRVLKAFTDPATKVFTDPTFGPSASDPGGAAAMCRDDVGGDDNQDDDERNNAQMVAVSAGRVFASQARLFADGVCSGDVIQGNLGDCWFLSALSVVATRADLLHQTFWRGDKYKANGLFVCRFMKNFVWHYVIVDDALPVFGFSKTKQGKPYFARCRDPNELWVALLEKAYAKLHGSYEALIGGFVDVALNDLTGMCSEQVIMKEGYPGFGESPFSPTRPGEKNGDAFWQKLLRYKASGTLMGCSIQPAPTGDKNVAAESSAGNGLYFKHAYALVDVAKIKTAKGELVDLVKLRNPWGMGEWTGPWSDSSDERTEHHDTIEQFFKILKRKVGGNANKRFFLRVTGQGELKVDEISQEEVTEVNASDGTFFMAYDAWMRYFTHFFAGIDFPDAWHGKRVEGYWNESNNGGNTTRSTWINNPRFELRLERRCHLFVSLSQEDPRGKQSLKIIPIGFHICSLTQACGDKSGRFEIKEPAGKADAYYRLYKEKDRVEFKNGIRPETLPPALIPGSVIADIDADGTLQPAYTFKQAVSVDVTMEPGRYCIIPSMYMRTEKDTGKTNVGSFWVSVYSDLSAFSLEGGEKIVEEEEGEDDVSAASPNNNSRFALSRNSPASTPGKGSAPSGLVPDSITMMEKRRKFEDVREEFLAQAKFKNIGLREVRIEFTKSATIKKVDCRRKLVSLGFKSDELSDEKFNVLFSGLDSVNSGSIYTDEILRLFEREIEEDQMACEVPEVEDDDVPEKLHQHGVLEIDVRAAKDLVVDSRLRGGAHRRLQRKVHFSAPEYTAQELSRRRQAATATDGDQPAEYDFTQAGRYSLLESSIDICGSYSRGSDARDVELQPSTLESGLHKSDRMRALEQKRRERLASLQTQKLAALGDRQKTSALPRLIGGRKSGSAYVSCVDCGARVLLGGRKADGAAPALVCAGANCTNSFCTPCFRFLPERKQFCDECFQHELGPMDADSELLRANLTGDDGSLASPREAAKLTENELAAVIARTLDEIIGAAFDAYAFSASTRHWLRTKNSTEQNALHVFHGAASHKRDAALDIETGTILFSRVLNLTMSDTADDGGDFGSAAAATVFELFDADRSGRIDQDEFGVFASALGLHLGQDDTQLLMCRMETAAAGDGSVGFPSFVAYVETLLSKGKRPERGSSMSCSVESLRDVVLQLDALASEDPGKREALCDILQQLQWNTRKDDAVATCKQIRDAVGLHLSVALLQRLENAVCFRELHPGATHSQRTPAAAELHGAQNPEEDALLELKSSGDVLKCLLFSFRSTAIPHLAAFHVGAVCERVSSFLEQLSGARSCESVWRSVFGLKASERIDQRDFLDTLVSAGYAALPASAGSASSPLLRRLLAKLEVALALDALRLKGGDASANDASSGFVTFSLFSVLVRFTKIQQLEACFDQALVNFLRLCQGRQHYLVNVLAAKKTLVVRAVEPVFKLQMDFVLDEHEYARENLLRSFPSLVRVQSAAGDENSRERRLSDSPAALITAACYPSLNDEMLTLISRLRVAVNASTTATDQHGIAPFLKLVESDRFVATLRASLARADLPFFWSVSSTLLELSIDGDYLDQLQRPSFQHVVAEAVACQSPASRALASLLQHTSSSLQVRYEVVGKSASFLSSWEEFQAALAGHQDTYAVVEVCPQGDVFASDIDRAGTSGTAKWNCKRQIVLREPEACDQRMDRPMVYADTVKVSAVPGGSATTPITFVADADSRSVGHFVVLSARRAQPTGRGDTPRLYCTAYDPFTACEYAVEGHPADWASDFFAPSSNRNIEREWLTMLTRMRLGATLTPKVLVRVFSKQTKTESLIGECEVSIGSAVAHEGHIIDDWFPLQHPMNSAKTTGFVNVAVRFEAKKASDIALALANGSKGTIRSRTSFVPLGSTADDPTSDDPGPLGNHAPVQDNTTLQAQKRARELEQALQTSETAKRETAEQVRALRSQVQQLSAASSTAVADEATQWSRKLDRALGEQRQQREEHEQRVAALQTELRRLEEQAAREREALRVSAAVANLKQASLGANASAHDIFSAMKDILCSRCPERPYNGLKKALAAVADVPGKVSFAAFDDVLVDFGLGLSLEHRKVVASILDPETRGRVSIEDFFIKLCGDADAYASVAQVRVRQPESALHIIPTPPQSEAGSPERLAKTMNWKEMKKFLQLNLPEGWETRFTEKGRPYFCNHVERSTQWKHPRPEIEAVFKDWMQENGSTFTTKGSTKLLAIAWYIIVPFLVDNHALHEKYTFTPRSVTAFTNWGYIMLGVIPAAVFVVIFGATDDNPRWLRAVVCAGYVVVLLAGNILGAIETSARNGYENQFAVKFNDFYCDTRTLRVCLEGKRDDLIVLTRGNATAVQASENPTDVALSIWSRCQEVLLESMAQEARADDDGGEDAETEGEKEIETKPLYTFLDDCSASRDIDMWCGNVHHYRMTLSDAQQQARPSPFASTPEMFARYKREWTRRMLFSNVLLGGSAVLLLVSMFIRY
ncbi:hypothetical protein PybrP1_005788 [[Pythium] brassicae (nom. inval.)]|nr:hypothetical protein PybrP1_005788 [[Pythium] brassicae (nom. inval.)]